ncbi:MAG: MarR family winged helix-turn-helix transcriptional regulator [Aeromicrobium sp.]
MIDRTRHPAYALHALVFLLDQAADSILPELDLTYSRFQALLAIERLGGATQRAIAEALGVTEPSASRAIRGLQDAGLAAADSTPGTGNRRVVTLTDKGQRVVDEAAAHLEKAFASLLDHTGVRRSDVLAITDPLLRALVEGTDS